MSELRKEGESGQRKINKYTRYGTVILSAFQAIGVSKMLAAHGIAIDPGFSFYFSTTITLVTGTMFLMWLGEQVTERGIGNGISMIIFAGIVAGLPSATGRVLQQVHEGQLQVIIMLPSRSYSRGWCGSFCGFCRTRAAPHYHQLCETNARRKNVCCAKHTFAIKN